MSNDAWLMLMLGIIGVLLFLILRAVQAVSAILWAMFEAENAREALRDEAAAWGRAAKYRSESMTGPGGE